MKRRRIIICVALLMFFGGTHVLFELKCVNAMQGELENIKEAEYGYEPLRNYDSKNSLAIKAISALGIIKGGGDCHADKAISRAQAAEAAIKFLKLEEYIGSYQHLFFDVNETHWASGYIELCAANGFVDGMGDGTFKPDENISYQQMIKIIVCMTGWGSFALEHGGWEGGGYIYAAKESGIIQDCNGDINRTITFGEAAGLLGRSLEINIRDATCSQQVTDKNIRNSVWDLERIEGIVERVDGNSAIVLVTDNSEGVKPFYKIGEKYTFGMLDTDIVLFAGEKIDAYATEDDELIVIETDL